MDLNDSRENMFLSHVELPYVHVDKLNDSSENLFLSQIDESVLNNEAIFNLDASFDLGLDLENFFNSCVKSDDVHGANASSDAHKAEVAEQEISADFERFGRPLTDEEHKQLKDSTRNKNTEKNTEWAIKIFNEWRKQRNDNIISEVHSTEKPTMAFWMSRFVMEVRKKAVRSIHRNHYTLRHLRDKEVHDKNFLDGKEQDFAELVAVIDSKMKTLLVTGHGANIKQADPISSDQKDKVLWDMGVLGSADAQSLQHTVFNYSCKMFGLRGRDEHRNLKCEQFQIGEDRNGKYIRFIGRDTKKFKGGLAHMSLSSKDI